MSARLTLLTALRAAQLRLGLDSGSAMGVTLSFPARRSLVDQSLSLRRARSVANELIKGGWSASAITIRGHGFDWPVAENSTPEGRAQNRRVVITVPAD